MYISIHICTIHCKPTMVKFRLGDHRTPKPVYGPPVALVSKVDIKHWLFN